MSGAYRIPSVDSAVRRFRNETHAYHHGRSGSTRGYNPGGFDSSDIHPMETHSFYDKEPELIGERNGVELWKTTRGHYAVGMMGHQYWVAPMADAARRR